MSGALQWLSDRSWGAKQLDVAPNLATVFAFIV
jgi:hypothetical protein